MKRMLIAALAAVALAVPTAANASPLEREIYSGTDSFDFDDCGFLIHGEVSFSGLFMLKAPRGDDSLPLYFDNYEAHEVLTANGRTLTIDHQGLYKDVRITLVEGTTYQIEAMEAGQPFVARDGEGNLLFHDRGLLRVTFQIDTLGDDDPENDEFVEGSYELLADRGRHPGFYLDFCAEMEAYFFD